MFRTSWGRGNHRIGEVFAFISGLYFRGKLAYTQAFSAPPPGVPGAFVIAAGLGLVPPETVVTVDTLGQMATIPIDAGDPHDRELPARQVLAAATAVHDQTLCLQFGKAGLNADTV